MIYVEGEWNPSLFCQDEGTGGDVIPVHEIPASGINETFREGGTLQLSETQNKRDISQQQANGNGKETSQEVYLWDGRLRREDTLVKKIGNTLEKNGIHPREVLLIAATDRSVEAAKKLGIAVAGYVNPLFPEQSFAGETMVIEGFEEVDGEFLERGYRRGHGLPWTIAVTKRGLLREMTVDDLDDLIRLYEQPGITWRLDEKGNRIPGFIEPLYPREEEKAYQEAYISNMYGYYGYGMWAVTDRESGKLIGRAGLDHREYDSGVELEMGYLIDPAYQRKGIATEVCGAIMDFARENLDFSRVNALTDSANQASVALLEGLGFVYLEDFPVAGKPMRRYIFHL